MYATLLHFGLEIPIVLIQSYSFCPITRGPGGYKDRGLPDKGFTRTRGTTLTPPVASAVTSCQGGARSSRAL